MKMTLDITAAKNYKPTISLSKYLEWNLLVSWPTPNQSPHKNRLLQQNINRELQHFINKVRNVKVKMPSP
ncbi:hypothetical protein EB796_002868 [Bugula neritina]|uniref:Uncharacterized protein n=1 Tax=Bugula neritina TaxID=10212 RepID=A0A7J7KJE2_BUGNE|nr:hypothetical protein EB796_002868 [Bugula neritina]